MTTSTIQLDLIDHYLNDKSYEDDQFLELIKEYYKDMTSQKARIYNLTVWLTPKIGPFTVITSELYLQLAEKYLRKIMHRRVSKDALYTLIYGHDQ